MKVFAGKAGQGKTHNLIIESSKTGAVIVCHSKRLAQNLQHSAKRYMGLDIPPPLSYRELLSEKWRGRDIPGILIDDIEMFLRIACSLEIAGFSIFTGDSEGNNETTIEILNRK